MAVEPIFDLAGTLEAIESRLPQGKLVAKVLLSLAATCAGWLMISFLAMDLFWPAGQIMVRAFSGTITFSPKLLLPWALAVGAAGAISFGLERWVHSIQTKMSARLNELTSTLEHYQSIFWKPLSASEKKQLINKLSALGRHWVLVTAVETTDCVELARDLRECFKTAKWQVSNAPLTIGHRAETSSGFLLWFKKGPDVFSNAVSDALLGATHGPISSMLHESEDGPDVQIMLGPKRIGNA